jgi:RimJ/RimL family protein N-acetyltransferase
MGQSVRSEHERRDGDAEPGGELSFRIRSADPSDAEQLAQLAESVSAEPEGWLISVAGEWRSAGDERRYLKALRRYPHAAVFVAERDDGTLLGRLSVGRDPHPASAHVADVGLMVAIDARRQGVGRALLRAAVGWARRAGVRKLELHVFPWNEAAIGLYESFGFEREGYRRAHYRRGGEYVDAILMARSVDAASGSPDLIG